MNKGKRVPEVRFPGFEEEWGQRKLSEMAEFSKGSGYSKADIQDKGTPIILYGRLYTNYQAKISSVDTFADEKPKSVLSKGNEVIVPASGETPEEISRASAVLKDGIILGGDLNIITPDKSIDPVFLASVLSSGRVQKELSSKAQGKAVVHLHNSDIREVTVTFPSLEEQSKINEVFDQLDETITLHQRKLGDLKKLKSGLLQKMFPQKGEKVPQVRFPGFTDNWEQRKLGEIVEDLYNGQTPSRNQPSYWGGPIKWLSSGELNRGFITDTIETITPEGQASAHLRIVPKGTFVMAITGLEAEGTRGNCGILNIDTTVNQSVMAIFPDTNTLSPRFLFQWYRKVGDHFGQTYTQGTKQQSYNAELIRNLDISYPSLKEQEKISDFFFSIDETITLHQRKFNDLNRLKSGLLQKMFP